MPEQAAYNVTYYDLSLTVSPSDSSIHGTVLVEADVVNPLDAFALDLDTLLTVTSVMEKCENSPIKHQFVHINGKIWIELLRTRQPGEMINLQITYNGCPRIAPSPPWSGGFTWSYTEDGSPWIATSCQGEGADIWWPNKDHISDKPDSVRLHIRVPDPLIVASNGRLENVHKHTDRTSTYHWFVSTPISNYNIALNIAPYKVIEENYKSVSGETIPISFWILPEYYEKGLEFFPQIIEHLRFYENLLGPYPFRADKYGVAQTPHLGMEHQTIIAYGAKFDNSSMTRGKDWGFDALHHHELAHEWWGNVVTASDWRDVWIHEGFGTYMQALYLEETQGIEAYHQYLKSFRDFWNIYPVAPRNSTSAGEIWKAPVYFKGAWILHTLRYLIGNEPIRLLLRRMIYPDPELEKITDGRQVRFVTTNDILYLAESISGQDLDWFFDIYLRQPDLPVLVFAHDSDTLKMYWDVPEGMTFPMPVEVKIASETERIEVPPGGINIRVENDVIPEIDPQSWILYRDQYPKIVDLDSSRLDQYVGKYQVKIKERMSTIEISRNDQNLFIKMSRLPKVQLYPTSQTDFFIKEADNKLVSFKFNEGGEVDSLRHRFNSRNSSYKKVE